MADTRCILLTPKGDVVVSTRQADPNRLPLTHELDLPDNDSELFRYGSEYEARLIDNDFPLPPGLELIELRHSASLLSETEYLAAAKGRELLHWAENMHFCGHCSAPLQRNTEISFVCHRCGREYWPQLSPAIMVMVKRDDSILLVHARTFSGPFYGLVAGFVETGESLEECVRREVTEETGLRIEDIRYVASQSWPFPASLMIGFTAQYAGGELQFVDGELTAGGFYNRDTLPQLPSAPSLARRMIDIWRRGELS